MSAAQPVLDMDKLNAFVGQFVMDLGAAVHCGMVVIGEKLGLYKALAGAPMDSAQLAARTNTDERYVREWLSSQAAGGYVTYDAKTNQFRLSAEQAFTLANEDSPAYLPGTRPQGCSGSIQEDFELRPSRYSARTGPIHALVGCDHVIIVSRP